MPRPVLFATNRASRAEDREPIPELISRAHFHGAPIHIEAITVTDTHRVYAATRAVDTTPTP